MIDGNQGNDVALMGNNDDRFIWDPGGGSDILEGQSGTDAMTFNGSAVAELLEASANGARVRFTRDVGNIVMDLKRVEAADVNAGGDNDDVLLGGPGADTLDGGSGSNIVLQD